MGREIEIKKTTKYQLAARVSQEEREACDAYCQERDMNVSQLVRLAVKEYMKNHQ